MWTNLPPAPWLEARARLCAQDGLRGLRGTGRMTGPGTGTLANLQLARSALQVSLACLDMAWPREERCCPPAYVRRGAGDAMIRAGQALVTRLASPPSSQDQRDLLWLESVRWFSTTRAETVRLGAPQATMCVPDPSTLGAAPVAPQPVPLPSSVQPRRDPVGAWDAPVRDESGPAPRARSSALALTIGIASVLAIGAVGYVALR